MMISGSAQGLHQSHDTMAGYGSAASVLAKSASHTPVSTSIKNEKAQPFGEGISPLGRTVSDNAAFNRVARSIGVADSQMGKVGKEINEMHDRLRIFDKFYPPYHAQKDEGAQLLESFSVFRKVIDQFTVSFAEDKLAAGIMGNSAYPPDNDVDVQKIGVHQSSRPAHSGPEGLDIKELADTSRDSVERAIENLELASERLGERRLALKSDAENLSLQKQRQAETAYGLSDSNVEENQAPELSDADIAEKTAIIEQAFKENRSTGMGSSTSSNILRQLL